MYVLGNPPSIPSLWNLKRYLAQPQRGKKRLTEKWSCVVDAQWLSPPFSSNLHPGVRSCTPAEHVAY